MEQRTDISFNSTVADELMADEVRVMRGGNVIIGEWVRHDVRDLRVIVRERRVVGGEEEGSERIRRHVA